jgi:hypothetical protein
MKINRPYPFAPFTEYIDKRYEEITTGLEDGNVQIFDEYCEQVYPFCLELYEIGKDLRYTRPLPITGMIPLELPIIDLISDIGSAVAGSVMTIPAYKKHLPKSMPLYNMIKDVINEEKFCEGRCLWISQALPKTKRTDGIDISKLLSDVMLGSFTVDALLQMKDGRFVKEVQELQKMLPKNWWIVWQKKIALYIEKYGKVSLSKSFERHLK